MNSKNYFEEELFQGRASQKNKKHNKFKTYSEPSLADMIRTASNMSQAILKVSKIYCKGADHAHKHLAYISRKGKLELTDQDGNILTTLAEQRDLIASWSVDFGKRSNSRDVAKFIFSAPKGSDPDKLKLATSKFLQEEFGGSHEYVFALHIDTDKPHIHAAIKMVSYLGIKINPRKEYIRKCRKRFAELCRKQGIMVEASSRLERGFTDKAKNSAINQMRKKGKNNIKKDLDFIKKLKDIAPIKYSNNSKIAKEKVVIRYQNAAQKLSSLAIKASTENEFRQHKEAAKLLENHAKKVAQQEQFREQFLQKISKKIERKIQNDCEIEL